MVAKSSPNNSVVPPSASGKSAGPRIVYPQGLETIIDVTQAPYFADNSGTRDCTAILVAILDDLLRPSMEGMGKAMELLAAEPRDNARLPNSFENRKQDGKIFGVFPYEKPLPRIIYFPKGTYLVSDTVCYSSDHLRNGLGRNWTGASGSRESTGMNVSSSSRTTAGDSSTAWAARW